MYHSSDYEPQPQQSGEVLHHRLQCTHILSHTKHTRIRKTHLSVYFSLNRAVSCGTTDRNAYTYSQTKYTNTHAYTYNTPERVLQPQQSGELLHHRLQYPHILSHTKHTPTRITHLSVYFSLNRAVSCGTTDRNATHTHKQNTQTHTRTHITHLSVYFSFNRAVSCGTTGCSAHRKLHWALSSSVTRRDPSWGSTGCEHQSSTSTVVCTILINQQGCPEPQISKVRSTGYMSKANERCNKALRANCHLHVLIWKGWSELCMYTHQHVQMCIYTYIYIYTNVCVRCYVCSI